MFATIATFATLATVSHKVRWWRARAQARAAAGAKRLALRALA